MVQRWSEGRSCQLGVGAQIGELQGWTCGDCGALVLNRGLHDRFHDNLGAGQDTYRPRVAFRR